jgi:hypothetical protein
VPLEWQEPVLELLASRQMDRSQRLEPGLALLELGSLALGSLGPDRQMGCQHLELERLE